MESLPTQKDLRHTFELASHFLAWRFQKNDEILLLFWFIFLSLLCISFFFFLKYISLKDNIHIEKYVSQVYNSVKFHKLNTPRYPAPRSRQNTPSPLESTHYSPFQSIGIHPPKLLGDRYHGFLMFLHSWKQKHYLPLFRVSFQGYL